MNDLPAVRWLLRVLVNPGWAPLAVVVMHLALAQYGLTQKFDHLLHFLGGASIAYFLVGFLASLPALFVGVPRWAQHLLVFTSSCTVAVFWEFAEFASDQFRGTSIQQSVSETMLDLAFGVAGAFCALLVIWAFRGLVRATKRERQPCAPPTSRPPPQLPTSPAVQTPDSQRTPSSGGCG